MPPSAESLPFVDEHARTLEVDKRRARAAVADEVRALTERRVPALVRTAWGLRPASGFAVIESSADRLVLRGEHRFARYELVFLVDEGPTGAVTVRARTSALFLGAQGRLYRALVISSGAHVIAVRWMLRNIARRAALRTTI